LTSRDTTQPGHAPEPSRADGAAATPVRHLIVILGDQLNRDASAWDGFDPAQDVAWMCEAGEEATHVPSSQPRIAVFLSAMRHFAAALRGEGVPLEYRKGHAGSLADALRETLAGRRVVRIVLTEPGEWRVQQALQEVAAEAGVPIEFREDRHFLCSRAAFAQHARGRRQLRMEFFYREMRQRHRVLMEGDAPAGGQWNFDADNRESFGREGPGLVPLPLRFAPDALTREVIIEVSARFAAHPGGLEHFGWPVTREQALAALEDFIAHRLPDFGRWQDAMWGGQPWLYHALVSSALNLKLLDPREVVAAAEDAWRAGRVPLAAAEGFIRQVLGWREYVRGVYWLRMPGYLELNALEAHEPLPDFYWTGRTAMRCLADTIGQTLTYGYAHHIQRLMVTGLYALLLGVKPREVHAWYLAMYVDAVEWVELPNTLGMSQHADAGPVGGRTDPPGSPEALGPMASKPYVATGQYIARMSDHCRGCRFDPAARTGERACPFTTLYWDFLARHEKRLAANPRMALQVKNLQRIRPEELAVIRERAAALRCGEVDAGP
jgi:deoxyribodipyrimidine photolyase-related protein